MRHVIKGKTIKNPVTQRLAIKKINLKQGLVSKNSYYNNVNRNIEIIKASSYPDKENGNVILAAHSGTSSISYFKNLYKLEINDEAKIYYKNKVYTYKVNNMNEMFYLCSSLISLPDISKWDTSNVEYMEGVFYGCESLISLPDISKWNIDKVWTLVIFFINVSL